MILVLQDFEARTAEVEKYFKFIQQIVDNKAELIFPEKKRKNRISIDSELVKILKANGFLILYNLIESSIKKSLETVCEALSNEGVSYKDVREEIKVIWIETNYKNFKNKNSKDIFNTIDRIASDLITMQFDSIKKISGNIDARKIKQFASLYGFSSKVHINSKDGNKLLTVKSQRNDLAHGVISFSECGKDYSLEEVVQIKKEVILYLKCILRNVDSYIRKKQYLKSRRRSVSRNASTIT